MIRRGLLAIAAVIVPVASFGVLTRRASRRLLSAPRTTPDEAGLGPALDGRRLAAAAPPASDHWEVPDADHSDAHRADPRAYESRTTNHLRAAFVRGREADL